MVFHSYVFILAFFPVSVMGYHIIKQIKSSLLNSVYITLVSLIFYFCSEIFYGYVFLGILLCNLVCYYIYSEGFFDNWDIRKS